MKALCQVLDFRAFPYAMTFDSQTPYVLLDDQITGVTRFFSDPIDIIQANHPDELDAAFQAIDKYQKAGHYLAGFLSCLLYTSPSPRDS